MRFTDVSDIVERGMVTYKGLPAPTVCDYLSRAASRARYTPGTEFQIGQITMVANTGTYVDAPLHRYADGKDLSELPLASLAQLPCVVARLDPDDLVRNPAIDRLPLDRSDVRGYAVLVHTRWDRHWRTQARAYAIDIQ
jgi:arylformamidase